MEFESIEQMQMVYETLKNISVQYRQERLSNSKASYRLFHKSVICKTGIIDP